MTTEKNDPQNKPQDSEQPAADNNTADATAEITSEKITAPETSPASQDAGKEPAAAQEKEQPVKTKPAKEKTRKEKLPRKGPHPLSWINLVLMLGLFALAAYAGWLGWQQQQGTVAEIAVLKDRLAQAQSEAGNLAAAEGDLLVQTQTLVKQTESLKEQVDHNTDRLGKLPGAERQDWLLAEAEYLLRMANQRLQLEQDVDGSLSMLQAADNVLVETRNPRLNPVRATIAREIQSLRASPAVDLTGAVLRLQTLQEELPQLPWLPDRLLPEEKSSAPEESKPQPEQAWYETLWHTVTSSLEGLIRIRERTGPVAAPLTPDQQYYLQQNMHLMLEQAQVALLRKQPDLYKHSLSRVQDWLNEYLLIDDQRTKAVKLTLEELKGWQVNPPLPDITESLLQLQKLVESQRRGTVKPAVAEPAKTENTDGDSQ